MNGPNLTQQRKHSTTWHDNFVVVDQPVRIISAALRGGDVEPETAEQAITAAETTLSCSTWGCRGYNKGGNAFDTRHEPSHLISPGDHDYPSDIKRLDFELTLLSNRAAGIVKVYKPTLSLPT